MFEIFKSRYFWIPFALVVAIIFAGGFYMGFTGAYSCLCAGSAACSCPPPEHPVQSGLMHGAQVGALGIVLGALVGAVSYIIATATQHTAKKA
jgi:hypothetical protein